MWLWAWTRARVRSIAGVRRRSRTGAEDNVAAPTCTNRHSVKIAREAALATLDKFNRGVFLLDDDGAVCFANRAAEAMVAKNDGLLLRRGRLQFSAVDANAVFEVFLANGRYASDSGGLVLRAERLTPEAALSSPGESAHAPTQARRTRRGLLRVHLRTERRTPAGRRVRSCVSSTA